MATSDPAVWTRRTFEMERHAALRKSIMVELSVDAETLAVLDEIEAAREALARASKRLVELRNRRRP